ncbi:hypothetical protein LCGC14_2883520, partial [marine sediment metagenome]
MRSSATVDKRTGRVGWNAHKRESDGEGFLPLPRNKGHLSKG